jgi:hypothetical protein
MKGSQYPPPVDSGGMNPVTPISVADFLYPLARTPAPTRFERRRQRLLVGKPRLPRVRRVVRNSSTSTSTSTAVVSPQFDQDLRHATINAQPPLDAKDCERPSNKLDGLTLEQTIRVAGLALSNPAMDINNRGEANEVTDGKYIDTDHLQKQLPITPVEYPPLYGRQRCQESAGDDPMFASAHSM